MGNRSGHLDLRIIPETVHTKDRFVLNEIHCRGHALLLQTAKSVSLPIQIDQSGEHVWILSGKFILSLLPGRGILRLS